MEAGGDNGTSPRKKNGCNCDDGLAVHRYRRWRHQEYILLPGQSREFLLSLLAPPSLPHSFIHPCLPSSGSDRFSLARFIPSLPEISCVRGDIALDIRIVRDYEDRDNKSGARTRIRQ